MKSNLAVGEQINLAQELNKRLQSPVLQDEMGLDLQAIAAGQAVRWNEFSLKHNNDGSFKAGIITDADINSGAGIKASKLAIRMNYKKSTLTNPSATANANGTVVDLTPPSSYYSIFPEAMDVVFGGTFGSETVTANIVVTYSDSTTTTITKTATAVGTVSLTSTDKIALIKDGLYITKIEVSCQSTISSSVATVTFNHCGFYL